jgi:voltage-gated potassium channel
MTMQTDRQSHSGEQARSNGNFLFLFIGLLLMLLVMPLTDSMGLGGRYSLTLLFALFMLVSVWSMAASRKKFQFGAVLVTAICVVAALEAVRPSPRLEALGLVLLLVFIGLSSAIAARNVFIWHRADLNSLLGAFCVYLQLGLIWAVLYRLLHELGLADFAGSIAGNSSQMFPDLIYFSFVTLGSLGYGDILPVGHLARTLAYLETVIGQFYLAVMVASLVGAFTTRRLRE